MSKAYIAGLVMVCGLSWHMAPASAQTLEDRVQVLEDTLACVTVQKNADGIVTDLFIDGCNVHIRNGMNATDRKNGLGNLIIGYNEAPQYLGQVPNDRSGSHNLVIGAEHIYTQTGGLLAGFRNRLLGPSASVTGGTENTAGGDYASISGGSQHYAGGTSASISGGWRNETQDDYSSISGGADNHAFAPYSSISGGQNNHALHLYTTVCGGFGNVTSREAESLCGDVNNTASVPEVVDVGNTASGGLGKHVGVTMRFTPLDFPRRFSTDNQPGSRIDNADAWAEVYIYPSGHWVINTHTSMVGGVNDSGTCVNYSFMLVGADDLPLEGSGIDGLARFGMPKEHMWCVSPLGGPADRYDSVAGDLDPALLSRTAKVVVEMHPASKAPDIPGLIALVKQVAQIGAQLAPSAAAAP